MLVAYEFLFEELAKHLEFYLIEERAQWLNSHFVLVYQKSLNNKLQELQNWCYDIATKYPDLVFNSDDFTSIEENALVSLINRDDLQIDEGKIWNYVIKWGIAQNPGLSLDPENWSHDDFITVKNTLKNCLPLIRYFQMSNEDIINNVQRYQQLFERNLWLDIMKKFMASDQPITSLILPPRIKLTSQFLTTNPIDLFSTVINDEHLSTIASWIDKLTTKYSVNDIPYDFKLLLRGSKNGFTTESFWNLCNNKTNVIIVMKVNDTNEILGGYNPIGWDMPDENSFYKSCNDCFLFSLNSCTNPISIFSPVVKPEFAIYCNSSRGPCFSDLNMFENFNQDSGCCCFHGSFKEPIRNISLYEEDISFFSVEDYEVFQIRRKTF
ncbi:hypothetical protein C2G38_2127750 [Gigaspora rosea]|uniref:TLDc domain-containing protein n=1 Tax=Gigaspora rosea TaxID=44941 RepID=A0A397TY75_9GLOM|nr:hypothetical protein C2G38_2127750 [Gigaspora rosea]